MMIRKKFKSEFQTYNEARYRCNNPKNKAFHNYGGRGIQFKFKSFEEFLEELGPRPVGYSLDRINNDGHYEPGNVRWATRQEQQINQRKRKNNSSGHKCIYWYESRQKYLVQIERNYNKHNVGYFPTLEEAIQAYNDYLKNYISS